MRNRKPFSKLLAAANGRNPEKLSEASHFNPHKLKRVLGFTLTLILVLYFCVAASVLALRYAVLPHLDTWRARIEKIASSTLSTPVTIGNLQGSWHGLETSLTVTQLSILDKQGQPALVVPRAVVTLSWRSLLLLRPILSNLTIESPLLQVHRAPDGTLAVAGITSHSDNQKQNPFVNWLLEQEAIVLRNGTVYWHDAMQKTPPVTVRQLRFILLNYRQQHRFGLQAEIEGGPLAGPLDVRGRFRHGRLSRIDNIGDWKGTVYLSTGPIDLPTFNRFLKLPFAADNGQIEARTWLKFSHGKIQGLNGGLTARELKLRAAPQLPLLNLPKLSLIYHAQLIENELSLHIRNLSMQVGNSLNTNTPSLDPQVFTAQRFHVRHRAATVKHGRPIKEHFSIDGDFLDIGLFAKLAHTLPLPSSIVSSLDQFKPQGLLRNYALEGELTPPAPTPAEHATQPVSQPPLSFAHYRLKADFENASLAALAVTPQRSIRLPGFTHLSGSISASERHGLLKLNTQKASITLPAWLDEPKITFDTLRGEANWTIKKSSSLSTVNAHVSSLEFANKDAAGTLQATYRQTGSQLGELDLQTRFSRAAIQRVPRYLPTTLSNTLRTYLGHSLLSGTAHDATIQIKGPLKDFPFSHPKSAGIWRIYAPFSHGSFNPSPEQPVRTASGIQTKWPTFDGIHGVFEINQNKLKFDVKQARYRGVTLSGIHGQIDDLANSENLILEGQASGPLNDLLSYLRQTPIPQWVELPIDKLQAKENAKLTLQLRIPCKSSSRIGATGNVTFLNNSLSFDTLPPLNALKGQLKFTEQSLALEQISAQLLGGKVEIAGAIKSDGEVTLKANGNLSTRALQGHLTQHYQPSPLTKLAQRFNGNLPYKISVQAPKDSPPTINAQANLRTVAIDLPAPLAKTAQQPMPLRFALRPLNSADSSELEFRLGPLRAVYLQRGWPQPTVVSGAVSFNRSAVLPAHGVVASAHFKQFDLDAWQVFAKALMTPPTVAQPSKQQSASSFTSLSTSLSTSFSTLSAAYLPTSFALHFNLLTLANRHWPNLYLKAWHHRAGWRARFAAPNITGGVFWHAAVAPNHSISASTLNAHLTKLTIPKPINASVKSQQLGEDTNNIPSLNLKIDDLSIHGQNLGALEMMLRNTAAATPNLTNWQLDKLQLTLPTAQLTAQGRWQTVQHAMPTGAAPATPHASFDFKLALRNAGTLLNHFGLPHALRDGSGTLAGNVHWRGNLTPIDYNTLTGFLSLDLQRGQIVQVEPGLGKLIGVFSLQSLAHFLTLDFRELTNAGLTFERMTASAEIDKGIVRTEDFKIASSMAKIKVRGTADLAQEQQNLQVDVKPAVSAGSAVLAATIVNPMLGIGSYVAQQVLSASVSRTLATQYSVSGSWNNPRIERINGSKTIAKP